MSEKELMARIAELEAENRELKKTVDEIGKKKQSAYIKVEFGSKYPWVKHMGDNHRNALSAMVRATCFPKVQKMRSHTWHDGDKTKTKSNYILTTREMTDEQVERYYEICGKLLAVLNEYEVVTQEWEEKTGRKI